MEKYYGLKIHEDFKFRHTINVKEQQSNCNVYPLVLTMHLAEYTRAFYIKLQLHSLKNFQSFGYDMKQANFKGFASAIFFKFVFYVVGLYSQPNQKSHPRAVPLTLSVCITTQPQISPHNGPTHSVSLYHNPITNLTPQRSHSLRQSVSQPNHKSHHTAVPLTPSVRITTQSQISAHSCPTQSVSLYHNPLTNLSPQLSHSLCQSVSQPNHKPHPTAVPLTPSVCITAQSQTSPHSCPIHSANTCSCTVTISVTFPNRCIWTRLNDQMNITVCLANTLKLAM
jgi:hypothetical protein